jgi:ABC-2 type transport system permease protein
MQPLLGRPQLLLLVEMENGMKTRTRDWRTDARVVWAIFAKDLREVIRNKNTITVLISGLFIVAMYRMLPNISRGSEPMRVWVYDQGQSGLAAFLENSRVVNAWAGAESLEKVEELLRESDLPELGLVIPADFDRRLEAGEDVALQGYLMSWVSPEDRAELTQTVEDEIARLLGRRVRIQTEGSILHLTPESSGPGLQASLAAAFLLTLLGASLVPHLMLAEKQERTLEVLLTSPAGEAHVVLGKALAGMVYCLIGGAIALAVNYTIVEHWWLAILAIVCFSLFAVALGLALGTGIETRAQLSLWSWVVFIPMFFPAFLVVLEGLVPEGVIQVLRFAPTVAFCAVWRYAFAQPMSPGVPLAWLAYLMVWVGGTMALVVWLMRQRERQAEGRLAAQDVSWSPERAGQDRAPTSGGGSIMAETGVALAETAVRPPRMAPISGRGTAVSAPRSAVRILWAIFAKDMREALSNKLLLSILLGTAVVMLNGAFLPLLIELQWKPSAVVYDEGRSTLVRGLMGQDDFRIRLAESQEEFDQIIASGPGTWLGLIIPADFDQRASDPAGIQLEGYVAHWAGADRVQQVTALFEERLGEAAWSEVHIDLNGHELYPDAQAGGQISINLLTVAIAMSAIGVAMVPLLLVEEKEAHTLDALLVSPARFSEVVVGKALVGGVYCMLAVVVALLPNGRYIVHWEIAVLAAVLSAGFAVSLGMLVGVLADNPTSAAMWATPLLLFILISSLAQGFATSAWPVVVRDVLAWTPGSVMINLFHFAAAGQVPASLLWVNVAALAGAVGAVYLLVGWRIRRLSR